MNYRAKLKIADIVVGLESGRRFENREPDFAYSGARGPDMTLRVQAGTALPFPRGARKIFTTRHFQDGSVNWEIYSKSGRYIYSCPLPGKEQVAFLNRDFSSADIYLKTGGDWDTDAVVYDFLQVLLIAYLARRGGGVIFHGAGLRDAEDGRGYLFAGRSGAGKSTMSRLWHRASAGVVLNDDRVVVRRARGGFSIHSCPWRGEFDEYAPGRRRPARLGRIFMLRHGPRNKAAALSPGKALPVLYPALLPLFWDEELHFRQIAFCSELFARVPCARLAWRNDARIIEFARGL